MNKLAATGTIRGRRREFDPDETLAKAVRVFWSRGFEGASLDELTEAMGISRPSLYRCFGSKEALFRRALDLYEHEKLAYVKAALEAPTARDVAERFLSGALENQQSDGPKGCLGIISSIACGPASEHVRADAIAVLEASDAALVARFERARAEGDLPTGYEPAALANFLKTVRQGLCLQAGFGASTAELKGLVDVALRVWPSR